MLRDRFGAVISEQWRSKSGNIHMRIELSTPLPVIARIALQAMLGSDSWREMMSLQSALAGLDNPIMLFKPPLVCFPRQ